MTELLGVSAALVAGLLMTRIMIRLKLPDVTAYLIAGVLLGPCAIGRLGINGLGFTSFEELDRLAPISDIALGFIAFAIGSEFRISHLKQTGGAAVTVGILQAVATTLLVDAVLLVLHFALGDSLPVAAVITLGAIAAATAPAATLMVVRQYKAKGPLTSLLLPVVALDDAVGLVLFAVSFGAARSMTSSGVSLMALLGAPLMEIVLSVTLGGVLGMILTQLERAFHSNRNRVSIITGVIILAVALAMVEFEVGGVKVGFSPLLVCMMLGTVFCNTCPTSEDLMMRADKWSAPLLTLFFVLSGAELDLGVLGNAGVLAVGAAYIAARALGKYYGARVSSRLARCDGHVQKYLGITLLPQAGVALGMSAEAKSALGAEGAVIRSVVLFGVLVYELVGPSLTKMALTKAGDIKPIAAKKA